MVCKDRGRICLAFVFVCVWLAKTGRPNLRHMADDAITLSDIGSLGIYHLYLW